MPTVPPAVVFTSEQTRYSEAMMECYFFFAGFLAFFAVAFLVVFLPDLQPQVLHILPPFQNQLLNCTTNNNYNLLNNHIIIGLFKQNQSEIFSNMKNHTNVKRDKIQQLDNNLRTGNNTGKRSWKQELFCLLH